MNGGGKVAGRRCKVCVDVVDVRKESGEVVSIEERRQVEPRCLKRAKRES